MALIDLQTDLTSLKYGSKLPAVRHKMGNKVSQFSARIDDVKRLGTILTQAPGRKFASNQVLLQNAKIGSALKGKKTIGGAVLAGLGAAFKATVGTGLFLTANAAKAGTGFHGVNPSVASSYLTGPLPAQSGEEPEIPGTSTEGKESFLNKVINTVSTVATAIGAQSSNYHAAQEILGGAQFVSRTYKEPIYKSIKGADQGKSEIYIANSGGNREPIRGKENDFTTDKIPDSRRYLAIGESELTGDDIKDGRLTNYYKKDEGDALQFTSTLTKALGVEDQDIIPFTFNFYTPGSETDKFVYFRALLDNLSDTYSSTWSGIKYIGRAEEFYTYSGFGRTMSFAFKAAAFSKAELKPIYNKLNHLVGSTAPTYGTEKLFMRGTLLKLTIGDYIKDQNGFLSSVSLTWNTDYPWEIGDNMKVPHLLDVSCEFTPIHSFNPVFGEESKKFLGV